MDKKELQKYYDERVVFHQGMLLHYLEASCMGNTTNTYSVSGSNNTNLIK